MTDLTSSLICTSSIVGKDAQLAICNQYSDRELTRWKLVTKWMMFFPEGKPRVLKLRLKTLKIGRILFTVPRLGEEISAWSSRSRFTLPQPRHATRRTSNSRNIRV